MIRIDPWAYVFGAALMLILPLDWLLAAVCAALFHEICHIVLIYILGGSVTQIRVGIGGAAMEAELPDSGRELLCALAGPVGSFLLVCACHTFPKLAICAGVQGLFNLLPVFPLDGGRALRCALELIWPEKAEKIGNRVELGILLGLVSLAVTAALAFSLGALPLMAAFLLLIKVILRKRPCKQSQIGVQ